jgi:hypothetical protein
MKDVFAAHGKHWDDHIKNELKNIVSAQVKANPSNALSGIDKTVVDGLISALETRLREKEKAQQDAAHNT